MFKFCVFGRLTGLGGFVVVFPQRPLESFTTMAKWLNCADIDFGFLMPRLGMRTVHRYIRSLNVQVTDVIGISAVFETRNQIVRLTFASQATCSNFLNEHGGLKTVTLEEREIKVTVKDSNEEEKYVRIAGLPHEMDFRII